jgi:hypothetical protein
MFQLGNDIHQRRIEGRIEQRKVLVAKDRHRLVPFNNCRGTHDYTQIHTRLSSIFLSKILIIK